jgi:CHAD domain-containing protein
MQLTRGKIRMADGKWIPDLAPTTSLADAARHVLTVRLDVVRHHLPLALRKADQDIEHVHQLRVGTRRAGAALRIFSLCLPQKVYDASRRQLRKLRRAAGAARDWDVFIEMLTDWGQGQGTRHRAGLDLLTGYATAQRELAQEHLSAAAADHPFAFDRSIGLTLGAIRRPPPGRPRRLIDLARPLLSALLAELDEAAARDLTDYANLHQVRIAGKRLRYGMEVFVDCFTERFRTETYPAIEEMQEILGRANDSHVARLRLEALRGQLQKSQPNAWKRCRLGVESLMKHHRDQLPKERKRFLEWWGRWRQPGLEMAFADQLRQGTNAKC